MPPETVTETQRRDSRTATDPIIVGSVPEGHVYVRHLTAPDPDERRVRRLPDPCPEDPTRDAVDRWWPPAMLEPAWVEEHAAELDVLHLHFGYDAATPARLAELVAALVRHGVPLVLTIHDLRNPHHDDPRILGHQLDVLVPAAAAIITLTRGAAREIERRWGVRATVVPHPHIVDLDTMARLRAARVAAQTGDQTGDRAGDRPLVVGVACKSLRRNTDPLRILPPLVETVRREAAGRPGGVRLVVAIHRATHDAPGDTRARALVEALDHAAAAGDLDLLVHEPMSDAELWDFLAGLDVAVLPYLHGTHSGWLEACRDLGTTVVAPTCGYYADQGAELTYAADEHHLDEQALATAVGRALDLRVDLAAAGLAGGVDEVTRRAQREQVARAHDELYAGLVR